MPRVWYLYLMILLIAAGCAIPGERNATPVSAKVKPDQPSYLPTVKAGNVQWNSAGGVRTGWMAVPMIDNPMPGLILITDESGLSTAAKRESERYAAHGYAVLVVDGKSGEIAVSDLQSAKRWLSRQPETRDHPMGCLGWGSGGRAAFALAVQERLNACVVLGALPEKSDLVNFDRLGTPVLIIAGGEQDADLLAAARDALALSGVPHNVLHESSWPAALGDPNDATVHSSAAGVQAKGQVMEFLTKHLGSGLYYQ